MVLDIFSCSSLFGEDSHFDPFFSDGLKPPTRLWLKQGLSLSNIGSVEDCFLKIDYSYMIPLHSALIDFCRRYFVACSLLHGVVSKNVLMYWFFSKTKLLCKPLSHGPALSLWLLFRRRSCFMVFLEDTVGSETNVNTRIENDFSTSTWKISCC